MKREDVKREDEDVGRAVEAPRQIPPASVASGSTLAATDLARLGPRGSWRGRYVILRPHAHGGLGTVSVALDETLGRKVALKQMRADLADVPQFRERFIYEAEITGQLEHPGIIPIYALGQDERGRPYYAMKFVEGRTLDQAIAEHHVRPTALALRDLLGRFVEVCNAIAYAHSQGIIHRDLKPSNIMLGKFGETVILDWGLAKRIGPPTQDRTIDGAAASGTATPGKPVGTPAFMPPEQAAGRADVGPAADVYSLGAVLYQLLSGQAPYAAENSDSVVSQVMRGPPPRVRAIVPSVPRALDAICARATDRDPRARPAAAELAREIERWLADEPLHSYRGTPIDAAMRWARRHRTASLSAVSALVAIILALSIATILIARAKQGRDRALLEKNAALVRENQQRALAEQRERLARRSVYAANMRAALEAWHDGDARRTLELLHAHVPTDSDQPDLRGFAWRYLWNEVRGRLLARLPVLPNVSGPAVFAPDGRIVAAGASDGSIHLFDVHAQRLVRRIDAGSGEPVHLRYAPDGATLACARPGAVQLIDVAGGVVRRTLDTPGDTPRWLAFSPDGALLAAAAHSGTIFVWDARDGTPLARWRAHESSPVLCCAFAPDSSYLASGGEDGAIRFWDARAGRLVRQFVNQKFPVFSISFAPDGKELATANAWGASVWDIQTARELEDYPHVGTVMTVLHTRDGARLAATTGAGQINLWERASDQKVSFGDRAGATSLDLSPDGRLVVIPNERARRIELWDTSPQRLPHRIGDAAHPASAVVLGADGALAIVGTSTGMIERWDTITGRMTRRADATRGSRVTALALAGDAGVLVAGDERGHVTLWDADTLAERARLGPHDAPVHSLVIAPDGGTLVSADRDNTVKVWDARAGTLRATFDHAGHAVALAADGEHLAMGGTSHAPAVVNLRTGQRISVFRHITGKTMALAFSPDGRRLAVGLEGGNARIYDWKHPDAPPVHILTDRFTVSSLAWFPDGEHVATTNPYGSIQLWDTVTREECLTLADAEVLSTAPLALGADGHLIATVSKDGTVALWRAPPPREPLR